MFKKISIALMLGFFTTSCADTFGSIKRGITGEKSNSADEFLVKKKDPLILPPDYESLPTPEEEDPDIAEYSVFEKAEENSIEEETEQSTTSNTENSILKKIQSK